MKNLSDIYTISINSEIVATNFWEDYDSPYHEHHLSFKMGVLRILCAEELGPQDIEKMIRSKHIFIVRIPHKDPHFICVDFTDENQVSDLRIISRNTEIEEHLPNSTVGTHFGVAAYLPDQDGRPVCKFRGAGLFLVAQ
ncbi:MAG: hypothetical protein GVY36_16995 [Verrucomicrobia bacterium]|jgi:hypothetical protein|nr:hypothetical protein [Verrucomicrobiota bacterium]